MRTALDIVAGLSMAALLLVGLMTIIKFIDEWLNALMWAF
jgi:hypothetical protein